MRLWRSRLARNLAKVQVGGSSPLNRSRSGCSPGCSVLLRARGWNWYTRTAQTRMSTRT
jgi:hypothetical protein